MELHPNQRIYCHMQGRKIQLVIQKDFKSNWNSTATAEKKESFLNKPLSDIHLKFVNVSPESFEMLLWQLDQYFCLGSSKQNKLLQNIQYTILDFCLTYLEPPSHLIYK